MGEKFLGEKLNKGLIHEPWDENSMDIFLVIFETI